MPGRRINLAQVLGVSKNGGWDRSDAAALVVQNEWKRLAQKHLHASSDTISSYIRSISIRKQGGRVFVELADPPPDRNGRRGALPNMMEQGLGPGGVGTEGAFDIRINVLKAKQSAAIPFDHTMESIKSLAMGGAAMNMSRAENVLSEVKGLLARHTERMEGSSRAATTDKGERLGAGHVPKRPGHVTDLLHGLVVHRKTHTDDNPDAGGPVFSTFRTISWKSKPWIHPGITARRIAGRVMNAMPRIMKDVYGD